jgi:hypothetical protein
MFYKLQALTNFLIKAEKEVLFCELNSKAINKGDKYFLAEDKENCFWIIESHNSESTAKHFLEVLNNVYNKSNKKYVIITKE